MNIEPSKRLSGLTKYAFAEIEERSQALRDQGITPIDFGVGDPSEPTPDFVIDGLEKAGQDHATTGYPSYIGNTNFRKACARYMKREFGIELDPATEITSTIGSKEAIFNFPEAFINPGDVVIIPSPGYPPMKVGTVFAEGKQYFVPLLEENGFMVDYGSIPEEICRAAKIIWINYPNSPTGAVATREYYEGLIEWARKNDIIIAADEGCYISIYSDEKPMSILEVGREGIITFYSLSKRNNMTGYRVGFAAGDEKVISIFKQLKTNIDSGTPDIIQDVAILALDDETHVEHMRELYKKKANILVEGLRAIGLEAHAPKATFYIWQRVPEGMSDIDFAKKLLEPEIAIVCTPGSLISDECVMPDGTTINPGAGYVRFALMPTIPEIEEAVKRLIGYRELRLSI